MSIFDKSTILIVVPQLPSLVLRSIVEADLEFLRQWKNSQRQYFFHQEEIDPNQHRQWWESFSLRPYDIMLITEYEKQRVGCMGVRWQEDHWDIYNVILGAQEFGGRGFMGLAFSALLDYAFALKPSPIRLQVLKHNPAVKWYQKQGFEINEIHDSFYAMTFQSGLIRKEKQ